ncbi:DUF882 domain-containing protein [Bradyrhizobium sp. 2TAF24]|uniref:DUF882 domain-containing protein n=1 Tax=Bradyrhizobium sp. 2TAF24 TaxID=3233011 RepID=UPI003F91C935
MLSRFARSSSLVSIPRAGVRLGVAALLLLGGARSVHDATASGDTRTLSFHHTHSGENLTVTFKRNGRYDEAALKQINHFLRDWRSQDSTVMDRHLFDILWEVYRDVDGKQPIQIISAYRSPGTNAMLRRRSAHSGVARFSQHMLGHAMDFYIPGVPLEQIRFAGLRLQRGGVGFYPTSGSPFVHLDTGNVRHWPRMTREQLVRVFPSGHTVHVPSDGNPLPGYQLALAEVQRRKAGGDGDASSGKPSLLAALFRGKQAEEDDEGPAAPAAAATDDPAKATPVALAASLDAGKPAGPIPLPRAKPVMPVTYQVASAESQTVSLPAPKPAPTRTAQAEPPAPAATAPKPQTPADIINARGFWDDDAGKPKQATPEQVARLAARNAFAAADPQSTASLPKDAPARDSQALAYAPPSPPIDRSRIVAASAPIPRFARPAAAARNTDINTVVIKGQQNRPSAITTALRLSPATNANSVWMRAMILAPSASTAMLTSSISDQDMTVMRQLFIKPTSTVAMTFSNDPQLGLTCERFSGSAYATLATTSFTVRTASLR